MSDRVACHEWEEKGGWIVRGGQFGERSFGFDKWQFCPTCGTGLNADGTVTARCDVVTSEAVAATLLYRTMETTLQQGIPDAYCCDAMRCFNLIGDQDLERQPDFDVIFSALAGGLGTVPVAAGPPRAPLHSADTWQAGGYKERGSDE